ncbi:hypothetical protein A7B70_14755 [Listeria monocytogenes]|nr:hypothetical protein [Listeria monocytogenes]
MYNQKSNEMSDSCHERRFLDEFAFLFHTKGVIAHFYCAKHHNLSYNTGFYTLERKIAFNSSLLKAIIPYLR